jgi:hypothetical protein
MPIPIAARSKAWAFGRVLPGIVSSNPTGAMHVCLFWVFACCQVEVSATDWSLVQRSPTESGVSECDLETSKRRRPRPIWAVAPQQRNIYTDLIITNYCTRLCPIPYMFGLKLFSHHQGELFYRQKQHVTCHWMVQLHGKRRILNVPSYVQVCGVYLPTTELQKFKDLYIYVYTHTYIHTYIMTKFWSVVLTSSWWPFVLQSRCTFSLCTSNWQSLELTANFMYIQYILYIPKPCTCYIFLNEKRVVMLQRHLQRHLA